MPEHLRLRRYRLWLANASRWSPTRLRRRLARCCATFRSAAIATSSTWAAGPASRPRCSARRFRTASRPGSTRRRRWSPSAATACPDAFFAVGGRRPRRSRCPRTSCTRVSCSVICPIRRARSRTGSRVARRRSRGVREPVRYRSDDPLFARYEAAVTAVVAARGATLWAGPVLDVDPPSAGARSTASSSTRCPRPRGRDVLAQRGDVGRRRRSDRRAPRWSDAIVPTQCCGNCARRCG